MFRTGKWAATVATGCLVGVGAVLMQGYGRSGWTSPYLWLAMGLLVAACGVGLMLGRRLDRMSQLALKDALTGLYNRRYLMRVLPLKLGKARREGGRVTVSMVDVNDFKRINDSFGHQVGDVLLQHIAYALDSSLGKGEIAARYGGDEFIIIGYGRGKAGDELRKHVDERLRQLSAKYQLELSVSIGTSVYPDDAGSVEELLHQADGRMFDSKCERKEPDKNELDAKIG